MNDLKFALRQLLKNRGFTAVAVLTLALGIGANTAIFSVVNAVLLRPLPFREPERLITLWERNPAQGYEQNMPATGNFLDWKEQSKSFEDMAMFESNVGFALVGNDRAERVTGARTAANLFQVLGINPILGRTFNIDETVGGRPRVALISYGLWQRRFGGDATVVGKPISLDGEPVEVLGVMPPKFKFPGMTGVLFGGALVNQAADVWVPLPLDGNARQVRSAHIYQVIGRLKPEVSLAQAAAEMDVIQQRLEEQHHGEYMGTSAWLVPLRTQGVANVRLGLLILLGAVVFVLLIACANVANLLLARAMARQKEIAVRLAMGATRGQLVRQLLTESLALALGGAALGLLLAHLVIPALVAIVGGGTSSATPGWEAIGIDRAVLSFVCLSTLVTTVLFGLAPAWQATQPDLQSWLKESARSSTGVQRHRLAGALVCSQIALTMMLLLVAGLFIQTFTRLQRVNPGFDTARILTMQLDLPDTDYPEDHHKAAFFERLLERVKILPGVESAGMTLMVPFGGVGYNFGVAVEGRSKDDSGKISTADWRPITPDYFRTLGIPLIRGRNFTEQDRENTQKVIIVNETFARSYLAGQDPLGKRSPVSVTVSSSLSAWCGTSNRSV